MNKLFVWLRSDLTSMTPGKAAAQVAHAASQAARHLFNEEEYITWEASPADEANPKSSHPKEAFQGFGTTIVLDGGTGDELGQLFYDTLEKWDIKKGSIVDPSYPLRDGLVTHLLEVHTCVWAFGDPDEDRQLDRLLKRFKLYNGNHGVAT